MMVSPKAAEAAGDKFALKPVCAGPYKFVERVAQDRIVIEKFADYWNRTRSSSTESPLADRQFDRASRQPALGQPLDMIERAARHRHQAVHDDPRLRLSKAVSLGFFGPAGRRRQRAKADNPLGKEPLGRQAFELAMDREGIEPGRVQRRGRPGRPGSTRRTRGTSRLPGTSAARQDRHG